MIPTVVLSLVFLSECFGDASRVNVAFGAKAVQSSTAYSGEAKYAVDGNTMTNYHSYSCTHTPPATNPWWRVDLSHSYNIEMISITNRGDCCEERINGAQIRVGNSLENNGNNNKLVATIESLKLGATENYEFTPVEGRFVNIIIPGNGRMLTLCEVQVFAENVAVGAKAVQSSTVYSGEAKSAVDGNTKTNYHLYSCTHTATETNPWWRVELPHTYTIYMVSIINRGDCCEERINGAQIRVGNSLENNGNNNMLVATVGSLELGARRTYQFSPVKGRFVNIIIPGFNKILTLCEVQVFTGELKMQNVALQGTATQSSLSVTDTWAGFGLAQNAIDGNQNSDLKKGSCTQTAEEIAPWWRVDLHRSHAIYAVALTNRGDCCSEQLNGAQIHVGSHDGKENPICATVSSIPAGQTKSFECKEILNGRYVTVALPGNGTLSLCEVEVFLSPETAEVTLVALQSVPLSHLLYLLGHSVELLPSHIPWISPGVCSHFHQHNGPSITSI